MVIPVIIHLYILSDLKVKLENILQMGTRKTKEPQYQCCLEARDKRGVETLGLMSSYTRDIDPKRLVFFRSRYKFVSKGSKALIPSWKLDVPVLLERELSCVKLTL